MNDSDPVTRLNTALEGRYTIERELGEGGMATVYLADDLKHERKIALKVLTSTSIAFDPPKSLQRHQPEIGLTARPRVIYLAAVGSEARRAKDIRGRAIDLPHLFRFPINDEADALFLGLPSNDASPSHPALYYLC